MGTCCSSKIIPENKNFRNPNLLDENNNNLNKEQTNKVNAEKLNNYLNIHDNNINCNNDNNLALKTNSEIPITNVVKNQKKVKNLNNYMKNLENQIVFKKKGEVNGEQIIFDSCSNSTFLILDFTAQVTIEKCKNCNFYIGPCKSRY